MKKQRLKQFGVMTLVAAMLVTQMPVTAFATSVEETTKTEVETESVEEADVETETLAEQTESEKTQEQSDAEETATSKEQQTEAEETASSKEQQTESESESVTAEDVETQIAEVTEELSEETTETEIETEEDDLKDSSGFVISNGVLTSYTGSDTEIAIPEGVVTIGSQAFKNNTNITKITFPSTVTTINDGAFQGCSSLAEVELNEGLVTIKEYAFQEAGFGEELPTGKVECKKLTIPSTVRSIGIGAFYNCTNLEEIEFKNGANEILEISSDSVWSYHRVFGNCEKLKKVTFPNRLETIPSDAFTNCQNLVTVVFGNKLKTIGDSAFKNCNSLSGIVLPDTVVTVGAGAFHGCSSLAEVELNEGLVTIKEYAFQEAGFGEELPTGKVECKKLTIPSTVRSIGIGAFYNCTNLEEIEFKNGVNEILEISSDSVWSYHRVFGKCENLKTVILPERLTQLQAYTFSDDSALTKLYIPQSVTSIDENAISNCPKLTIYGVSGSAAETYAKSKGIKFSAGKPETDYNVKSVTISPAYLYKVGEDVIGEQTQLTVAILPNTAQNKKVTWVSSNETVATVNDKGLVTITGYGTAVITVTTEDGAKTARCTVLVLKEEPDERPEISSAVFPGKKTVYSAVYTGEQICPVMTVSYEYKDEKGNVKSQKLKLNVDYTVQYGNNVNVSTETTKATVTVTGIGEYKGTITKDFTITPKSISKVSLSAVGDIKYDDIKNGETPKVTVMDGTKELVKGTDYTVELTTEGSATADTESLLIVKGKGNYTDTSNKGAKFNILRSDTAILPIKSTTITVAWKNPNKTYTYNGKAQKPAVVVTDTTTGKKLSSGNYKVIYTNNVNAGTATAYVVGVSKKGQGYYGISEPLTFTVNPKSFSKVSASLKGTIPKSGSLADIKSAINEAVIVKDGKHVLSYESEYSIDYGDIGKMTSVDEITIGKQYEITVSPEGEDGNYKKYDGDKEKVLKIKFGQLNLASKTAKVSVDIVDVPQKTVMLYYNGKLVPNTDYTVASIKEDKKTGTYTVNIKAVKNSAYKGSRTFKKITKK